MGINDKLNRCKAVIFDLDGTIVDSMWMWGNIDIEYLNRFNIECPSDLQEGIGGRSFYETAVYFKERFNLNDSIEEIMSCWNNMAYDKYINEVNLKPGFEHFLTFLRDRGIKIGVATSNSRRLALAALNGHGIADYFGAIMTGDECIKGKPEPDVYLKAALKLGVKPKDCIVFEDLPAGIIAGKKAEMVTVAIEDKFSEHLREEKLKLADFYINDYKEIMNEICNA